MSEATNPPRLKRVFSLPSLTAYGVGTMIGGGFYALLGRMAAHAGMTSLCAILLAAMVALVTAFSFAELAARFPVSAGESRYVHEGFHRRWLSVCVGWLVIATGTVSAATLSRAFVGFVQDVAAVPTTAGIVLVVAALTGVSLWGIAESMLLVVVITAIEVAGLLWVLVANLPALAELGDRLPDFFPSATAESWSGIAMASVLAFYAFIGFEDMVNEAEEVQNPQRTIPWSILLALGLTAALYVSVATVAMLAVPIAELADSRTPLSLLVGEGRWSQLGIAAVSMLAGINGALVQVVMASRVAYGMSRQGMGPRSWAVVHPRLQTPIRATLVMGTIVLVLALWLPLETLARLTSGIMLVNFALVNASLVRVKWRTVEHPPDVPQYPLWIPIAGCLLCTGLLLLQIGLAWR